MFPKPSIHSRSAPFDRLRPKIIIIFLTARFQFLLFAYTERKGEIVRWKDGNIVSDEWQWKRQDWSRRKFGELPKMKMEAYLVFLVPNYRVDEPSPPISLVSTLPFSLSTFLLLPKGVNPLSSFSPWFCSSLHLEPSPAGPEIRRGLFTFRLLFLGSPWNDRSRWTWMSWNNFSMKIIACQTRVAFTRQTTRERRSISIHRPN